MADTGKDFKQIETGVDGDTMTDVEKTTWAVVGVALLTIIAIPLGVIWSGYVLSVLWGWFVVTSLGAPPLSIPAAIGINVIVHYMTWSRAFDQPDDDKRKTASQFAWKLSILAIRPLFALGLGYIVKAYL